MLLETGLATSLLVKLNRFCKSIEQ
ncbi:unnamed protein product, partial [Allacma fusca]